MKPRYQEHGMIQIKPTIELCVRCGRSVVHYAQHKPQCWCGEDEAGEPYVRLALVDQFFEELGQRQVLHAESTSRAFRAWLSAQVPVAANVLARPASPTVP